MAHFLSLVEVYIKEAVKDHAHFLFLLEMNDNILCSI